MRPFSQSAPNEKRSLRAIRRDVTRSVIVEAALQAFDRHGFHNTTMEAIAIEGGLSRATLYLHFSNKADILYGAFEALQNYADNYPVVSRVTTKAEADNVFRRAYEVWTAPMASVWRHIRDAMAVDQTVREWYERYEAGRRAYTHEALRLRGVSPEEANAWAFVLMCMWSEVRQQLANNPDIVDREALVSVLGDVYLLPSLKEPGAAES